MASAPAQQVHEMTFVPQELVTIQVGRLSASAYPKIDSNMPIFENAHAFQVVKNVLEPLSIDTHIILDGIGMQLNCSAIVYGLIYDWRSTFDEAWFDFRNHAIISFHDYAGAQINNTTIAGNPAILLPVQDGVAALCCRQGVSFVQVMCTIVHALMTIANPGLATLCVRFYIKLPQTTVTMTNAGGVAYNLTTWHGTVDLTLLTRNQVCTTMLKPSLQDGPISLSPPDFNLGDANIYAVTVRRNIHAKILHLSFKQIAASIFVQLCPSYSNQPHAVLKHIHQMSTGADSQPVTTSVIEYYQRMMNAARPFATQRQYAISVCNHFIQGLDCTLMPQF
jgi:hypothetical protein